MLITIVTLFPDVFNPILNTSILKRAQKKGLVEFELVDLRTFGEGIHQIVDGRPYGGGVGMVLKADVLAKAVRKVTGGRVEGRANKKVSSLHPKPYTLNPSVVLTSASGQPFTQKKAQELSKLEHIILVCGHYEGVDQRFIDKYVDEELSIGDFVLTGGEIPAMAITDAITRLIPGVLLKPEAIEEESFSILELQTPNSQLLEYPQYTRPDEFEGEKVPDVLVSGNHGEVKKWRQTKSLEKTKKIRPDLLK